MHWQVLPTKVKLLVAEQLVQVVADVQAVHPNIVQIVQVWELVSR